ncbi:MAG: hypothetical protein AB8B79_17755 [Granulosicoccus sp.]
MSAWLEHLDSVKASAHPLWCQADGDNRVHGGACYAAQTYLQVGTELPVFTGQSVFQPPLIQFA